MTRIASTFSGVDQVGLYRPKEKLSCYRAYNYNEEQGLNMKLVQAGLILMVGWTAVAAAQDLSIAVKNASFEDPLVDPNAFQALPWVDGWLEFDVDQESSLNTGVFANTPADSPGHIGNAHGGQLAFLGSESVNALDQDLGFPYRVGFSYRMTVAVGVSAMFPPAAVEPVDTLELSFYYLDQNEPVDIVTTVVDANGLSSLELQDFSVELAPVHPNDVWAGQPIGIGLRAAGLPGGFWDLDDVRLMETLPETLDVNNASFEGPVVDPNAFQALPWVDGWLEMDVDTEASLNTGVFANTDANSPGHIVNADGAQLAFLGSEQGNAFEQDLDATFQVNSVYRLSVGVGVSALFPPSTADPCDLLDVVLYYHDGNEPVDIVVQSIDANGLSYMELQDVSVYLPMVTQEDAWADQPIGIALRSRGSAGGFWDLDQVRLDALLPEPLTIEIE